MSDEDNVRFLFRKVQYEGLHNSIEALKALETTGAVIICIMATNDLFTAVLQLPEYLTKNTRNISSI